MLKSELKSEFNDLKEWLVRGQNRCVENERSVDNVLLLFFRDLFHTCICLIATFIRIFRFTRSLELHVYLREYFT